METGNLGNIYIYIYIQVEQTE